MLNKEKVYDPSNICIVIDMGGCLNSNKSLMGKMGAETLDG